LTCFRRGIEIQDRTRDQKIKDLRLWLSISNLRNVPNVLLLFSRIIEYADDIFEIDEDEDEYEVLRRVSLNHIHTDVLLYRHKVRFTLLRN
jgi:hypothetical protein